MADKEEASLFSEEEKDILQEIMNIAFGNATADLAQVIDIRVKLSVPSIELIEIRLLPDYLKGTVQDPKKAEIVEQKFWGYFKGSGLLVFPGGTGGDLMSILDQQEATDDLNSDTPMATLEVGVLMEIGNILIGACVGKVSELLGTYVTYSPPQVMERIRNESDIFNNIVEHFESSHTAIIMKTVFTFEAKDISGYLMIFTDHESIGWLRKALNSFMASYE